MPYSCAIANYNCEITGQALISLLNRYAEDPMGGGLPLSLHVKENLLEKLSERTDAISLIAYCSNTPVGLMNAFEGFSTFAAAPLINVHDVYIEPEHRGKGLLGLMFKKLELIATERNCCKLTLEVLAHNETAKKAYKKLGFDGYSLSEATGEAIFWQKKLSASD